MAYKYTNSKARTYILHSRDTTLKNGTKCQAVGLLGGEILEAVHRALDGIGMERGLQLGGEEALAPDEWQGRVENAISLGLDDHRLDA